MSVQVTTLAVWRKKLTTALLGVQLAFSFSSFVLYIAAGETTLQYPQLVLLTFGALFTFLLSPFYVLPQLIPRDDALRFLRRNSNSRCCQGVGMFIASVKHIPVLPISVVLCGVVLVTAVVAAGGLRDCRLLVPNCQKVHWGTGFTFAYSAASIASILLAAEQKYVRQESYRTLNKSTPLETVVGKSGSISSRTSRISQGSLSSIESEPLMAIDII